MKRLLTIAMALSVCLVSAQFARAEDQANKPKKKAKTVATPAAKATAHATGTTHVTGRRLANPQFKPGHSNPGALGNNRGNVGKTHANLENSQVDRNVTGNAKAKNFNRTRGINNNVVRNNNFRGNTKAFRHFTRTGNELSFAAARRWNWHERHQRDWWRRNNFQVVLYGGGYWYWNAGWWYPAYGYDPYYSHYVYDGPIFGYGQAAPGDVTSEVQQALSQQGYYYGPIDGILGPGTRSAIQRFQADRGLPTTAAIDEPTLATLGLA